MRDDSAFRDWAFAGGRSIPTRGFCAVPCGLGLGENTRVIEPSICNQSDSEEHACSGVHPIARHWDRPLTFHARIPPARRTRRTRCGGFTARVEWNRIRAADIDCGALHSPEAVADVAVLTLADDAHVVVYLVQRCLPAEQPQGQFDVLRHRDALRVAPLGRVHGHPYRRQAGPRRHECPAMSPLLIRQSGRAGSPPVLHNDSGNGRIACAEARNHGIAPAYSTHPAYPCMTDAHGDGIVCR